MYQDGEMVLYKGNIYKAYKSKMTYEAFKLRSVTKDLKEELVDISEIQPYFEEPKRLDLTDDPRDKHPRDMSYEDFKKLMDSDSDASGMYGVTDR